MAGTDDEGTPPGWYRQPDDPRTLRWWDGRDWTDDTMPASATGESGRGRASRAADADRPTPVRPPASTRPEASTRQAGAAPRARSTGRSPAPPGSGSRDGGAARPQGRPAASGPARPSGSGSADTRAARRAPQRSSQRPAAGARTSAASRTATSARTGTTTHRAGAGPATRAARPPSSRAGAAAHSERIVRRRPGAPPLGVTIALRALLLAVVVGVLYLGYAQIRDAAPPDARTVEEDVSSSPDEEFRPVSDAVLRLDDLPAGWAAQAHDPGVDDVCHGRVPRQVLVPTDVASTSFTQGAAGPYLTNVLARFADEDEARAFMDLTERVIESCREYEANGATVRLGPLDYPRFGDDTFVAAATGESQFGPLTGRIVYVRVGSLVASVETIAFGDTEVSDNLVEHLSNELAKRLRAL